MKYFRILLAGLAVLGTALLVSYWAAPAIADPLASPHYTFQETSLGGTGLLGASSANYQALESASILGVGNSDSTGYILEAGNQTTGDPALTFAITTSNVSFNQNFSAGTTSTATATFQVLDYTSYGYTVQIFGSVPTFGGHDISALASPTQPATGVDQFGINLVANTNPASLGANPDNGQFGYGEAHTNYNTSNFYIYNSGDIIADGPKSSGLTNYTISFIVDVGGLDPAGAYTSGQMLLCTATY